MEKFLHQICRVCFMGCIALSEQACTMAMGRYSSAARLSISSQPVPGSTQETQGSSGHSKHHCRSGLLALQKRKLISCVQAK